MDSSCARQKRGLDEGKKHHRHPRCLQWEHPTHGVLGRKEVGHRWEHGVLGRQELGHGRQGRAHQKTPAPADGGPGGAAASVSRPRGRPPNPPLVAADSPEQAAVRARLHAMSADSVGDLCGVLLPQDRSWVGQPKLSQVEKLMAIHNEELARLLGIAPAGTLPAAPPPVPAADTPAQAALSARLRELPRRKLADVCRSLYPPTDFGWRGLSSKQRVIALLSKPDEVARALGANNAGSAKTGRAAAPKGAPPPPPPPRPSTSSPGPRQPRCAPARNPSPPHTNTHLKTQAR